ncbi:MAG: hypothetical protein HKN07_11655, partial [Acidimicrobiia bacterium]|nr:hypothetical protein [Acidimicrobiia bacterium]
MRRLLILAIALAMVTIAPAAATAVDFHEEFTLTTELVSVGVTDDGGELFEGWHYLYDTDGNLADDGPAHAVVYSSPSGATYTGYVVYEGTEATVVAKMRGAIIGFEETDAGFIVTFAHAETIVEAPGFAGRGSGTVVVEIG